MESWRRSGDFRQRERRAERATQRRGVQQRARAAAQTHEAIDRFEDVLKFEQDKVNRDFDDLPAEAEDWLKNARDAIALRNTYSSTTRPDSSHSDRDMSYSQMQRSHSDPQARMVTIDNDPCMMRPPSPLTYYDYGGLSVRPRSTFAQQKQRAGESTRAKYRQTSCGFYFPGPQFKQGPYGFSMLDPVLMAPRAWKRSDHKEQPPARHDNDPGDLRPLEDTKKDRRNQVEAPHVPDAVRTTRGHSMRADRSFRNVDKNREEKLLEQVRFENGMYEGKFRDPMLERGGLLPEERPEERHDWLGESKEDMYSTQQLASRVLFGLQGCLRASRGKVTKLFQAENKSGPIGVLEPEEFLTGLVRLGVLEDGEMSVDNIVEAISVIDPNFHGAVSLPVIGRAVAAAHMIEGQRTQAAQQVERQHQAKLSTSYSESLPVEVVKVDRESRSLFNFERSFEKFRNQQRVLLAHHNELGH